jgi:hypothetical protein
MRNAIGRALGGIAAAALFLTAAQTASAQQTNGCPAGQAMQSSDPSGRNITCVAIPNVSGLQGQISAETAARQAADAQLQGALGTETAVRAAADTQLQGAISAETAARIAGDAQVQNALNAEANSRLGMDATLLQAIGEETTDRKAAIDALRNEVIEESIVGTYTFSGPVTCLSSSNGFKTDGTFTPNAAVTGGPSTVVQLLSGMSSGTRTFNADFTGTLQVTTVSLLSSSAFFTATGAGVAFSPFPNPSGGASTVDQSSNFTWKIEEGKLIITETNVDGTITAGNRVGWSVANTGVPRQVGVLGKDLRIIALTTEGPKVENSTQTSPDKTQSSSTDRICVRERLMRKL